jgi:hypothetical protein
MFFISCSGKSKTMSYESHNAQKNEYVQVEKQDLISNQITQKSQNEFNHSLWNNLLQLYVTDDGHVNYKGFKADEVKLDTYLDLLSKNKPNTSASHEEKLAFWINAYNAFTIKLILNNYPLKSIKDINKPWDNEFITIDGEHISLGHIEHEILRKMREPRIHFAIVCASISCPKLQNTAFESSTIDTQLTHAAKEFLADSSRNNITQNKIKISKIFSWFSSDFKQNGSLIDFLNKYSEITISQKAKKSYKDYNWNLNE